MMGVKRRILVGSCVGFVLLIASCIDPYNPPQIEDADNYLVVDGFLDSSTGDGTVILTQTISLSDGGEVPYINNAQIQLEIKEGGVLPFTLVENGTYKISSVTLADKEESRIRINWNGKIYYSEFVASNTTPPIDSITWDIDPNNLDIKITTHDANDAGRYYRWKYVETYEYVSAFHSGYYYNEDDDAVYFRGIDNDIYRCWATAPSTNVFVATTTGLNENRIDRVKLISMSATDFRIAIRYSILVTQFSISKEEFDFWTEIKKSTESIGTIFDPLPSRVLGNLYSESASAEPVLGYFTVSSAVSQRMFIDNSELPRILYGSSFTGCHFSQIDSLTVDEFFERPKTTLVIALITDMAGNVVGYTTAGANCTDCRTRNNGKTMKPDFW